MSDDEVRALFLRTLEGDYDDDAPWDAVHALRKLGTSKVFDLAVEWCRSPDDAQRARGLDVLAQIGSGGAAKTISALRESALPIILKLLSSEKAAQPIVSAIYALGHIGLPEAVPMITSYVKHFNPGVREAVAFALASFAEEQAGVQALLILMEDENEDVRDWATFSLGTMGGADNDRVREALARALDDEFEDVRFEAAIGLGRRRDRAAVGPLIAILREDPENSVTIEAAKILLDIDDPVEVPSEELLGALSRMKKWNK